MSLRKQLFSIGGYAIFIEAADKAEVVLLLAECIEFIQEQGIENAITEVDDDDPDFPPDQSEMN